MLTDSWKFQTDKLLFFVITVNSVMVMMFMITIMIENLTMGYIGEIGLLIDLFGELSACEARTVQVKRCQWI